MTISEVDMAQATVNADAIKNTDEQLRARYSNRLHSFGYDPKTLGWDTAQHQNIRFNAISRALPKNKAFSLCDIGCGFGDLRTALVNAGFLLEYHGIDINADLIQEASQRHPDCDFSVRNILLDDDTATVADWVCALGVLNFRFTEFDNEVFARQFIRRAFALAKQGLVVDMLSSHICSTYPQEDFVYYYSPEKMLSFALELTPHVQLFHDCAPIPQQEFQLVLKHESEHAL